LAWQMGPAVATAGMASKWLVPMAASRRLRRHANGRGRRGQQRTFVRHPGVAPVDLVCLALLRLLLDVSLSLCCFLICRQRPPPEALHLELPKAFVATPAASSGASAQPQQAMQQQQQPSSQQQQQQNVFSSHGQAPSNLFAIPEFAAERVAGSSSSHFAHLEAGSSASSMHSIDRLPSASKSRSGARMRMPAAGDGPS
jgi:hypothetical protein